jgi:hypothetical protein
MIIVSMPYPADTGPPVPLVSMDFENGVYAINGASQTVDDVLTEDTSFGSWNSSTDITPGLGLITFGAPILSSTALSAALAGGLNSGVKIVMDYTLRDPAGDFYWSNVVFRTDFEGYGGSSGTDQSPLGQTISIVPGTSNGTVSSPTKWGSAAAQFHTTETRSYSVPDNAAFFSDTDHFTIEGYFRWNSVWGISTGYHGLISKTQYDSGNDAVNFGWELGVHWNGSVANLDLTLNDTTYGYQSCAYGSFTLAMDTYYHIAADWDGTHFRIYVDGVCVNSQTMQDVTGVSGSTLHLVNPPQPMRVGGIDDAGTIVDKFVGYADDIRVTAGVARYASDSGYTVPTAAFPVQPQFQNSSVFADLISNDWDSGWEASAAVAGFPSHDNGYIYDFQYDGGAGIGANDDLAATDPSTYTYDTRHQAVFVFSADHMSAAVDGGYPTAWGNTPPPTSGDWLGFYGGGHAVIHKVDIFPNTDPPLWLAFMDFQHGVYFINGVSKTVDDLIDNTTYGSSSVVTDQGLTLTQSTVGSVTATPKLTSTAVAAILAAGISNGFTAVIEYDNGWVSGTGKTTCGVEVHKADLSTGWGVTLGYNGESGGYLPDTFYDRGSLSTNLTFTGTPSGEHTVAINFKPAHLAATYDRDALQTTAAPQSNSAADTISIPLHAQKDSGSGVGNNNIVVERLYFYALRDDANLTVLSNQGVDN